MFGSFWWKVREPDINNHPSNTWTLSITPASPRPPVTAQHSVRQSIPLLNKLDSSSLYWPETSLPNLLPIDLSSIIPYNSPHWMWLVTPPFYWLSSEAASRHLPQLLSIVSKAKFEGFHKNASLQWFERTPRRSCAPWSQNHHQGRDGNGLKP